MKLRNLTPVVLTSITASTALGHEGHGHAGEGASLMHYVTQSVHMAPMLVIAAAIVMSVIWWKLGGTSANRRAADTTGKTKF